MSRVSTSPSDSARPARVAAARSTDRYMSGQSTPSCTPSHASSSALEWFRSENVSPTPRTTASKSGTGSLLSVGDVAARAGALHETRGDLGRTIARDVRAPGGQLLEPAGADLGQLRVGGDEHRLDLGRQRAVRVGERDLRV